MRNPLSTRRESRFNPARELQEMQSTIDRLFNEIVPWGTESSRLSTNSFSPVVSVSENKEHYLFKFDMPGIPKDQIRIQLENNVLTVSAERKEEHKSEDEKSYFSEISYGSYERSFSLPSGIDESKIQAQYNDGVLTVQVRKPEQTKSKQIEVH